MSKIRDLTVQVASIPEKEKRKNQVGALETTRDKVRSLTAVAKDVANVCATVAAVNDATFVGRARQALVQAGTSAKQLSMHIAKGGMISGSKPADVLLTALNERVTSAATTIQRGWSGLIQGYANRYRPLADVAGQIGLPGGPGLYRALSQVKVLEATPPMSAEGIRRFNAAIDQIRSSVESLGLEGKAGAFMVAAAQGKAAARDLLHPEVVSFLDEHPAVWGLLQVKL